MSSLWGDPDLVNTDPEKMGAVTLEQINLVAANILQPHKANTLIYKAKKD